MAIVIFCSYCLASVGGLSITSRDPGRADSFLFEGNRIIRSAVSNVGSYVSLTTFVCGTFYLGYKYSWYSSIAIMGSVVTTCWVLWRCKSLPFKDDIGKPYHLLIWFVFRRLGMPAFILYLIIIIAYCLGLFIAELTIIKYAYIKVSNDFKFLYIIPIAFFALLCVQYVWRGGYKGVLYTDIYQVTIVVGWIFTIIIFLRSDQWNVHNLGPIFQSLDLKNSSTISIKNPWEYCAIFIAIGLYMTTIFLCCIGMWTRCIGTLKSGRIHSIILSGLFISLISIIPIALGHSLGKYYVIGGNPLRLVMDIILFTMQTNPMNALIGFMALTAIALTTIDSASLMIVQHIEIAQRLKLVKKRPIYINDEKRTLAKKVYNYIVTLESLISYRSVLNFIAIIVIISCVFTELKFVFNFLKFLFTATTCLMIIVFSAIEKPKFLKRRDIEKIGIIRLIIQTILSWNKYSCAVIIVSIIGCGLIVIFEPQAIVKYTGHRPIYTVYLFMLAYYFINAISGFAILLNRRRSIR